MSVCYFVACVRNSLLVEIQLEVDAVRLAPVVLESAALGEPVVHRVVRDYVDKREPLLGIVDPRILHRPARSSKVDLSGSQCDR